MTPTERKVALLRRGVSISDLARDIGFAKQRGNVSDVINGRRRSAKIEKAICEFLGVDHAEWFPPRDQAEAVAA